MSKKELKGKTSNRYYFNEHDDNQVSHLYYQRKRKKRKLRLKRVGIVLAGILILGFLISPYSRVQKITVEGNRYISEKEIIELANVDSSDFHLLVSSNKIEKQLMESGIIDEVTATKGLFSQVTIKIKEATPLAYQENENGLTLLGKNGEIYQIGKDSSQNMNITTRLLNFNDEEILKEFALEYAKVSDSIRSLVSDITFCPVEPYDNELIQFDMNDGKKVYIHKISNLASEMKYYQEILSTKPNACVYDIHGKNVYVSECE